MLREKTVSPTSTALDRPSLRKGSPKAFILPALSAGPMGLTSAAAERVLTADFGAMTGCPRVGPKPSGEGFRESNDSDGSLGKNSDDDNKIPP